MEKVGLRDGTRKNEVAQQETSIDMKEARKAHFERQSENTRRMMKESRKRSRKLNRSRGRSWIERFLGL
ncbi:MAG: hypothetical protein K9G67_05445 [Bacteroidales bacterium]|nr:hypothetical protein [Bacteroidales bacterium]MCF8344306.1 hypothetical protein [Bacteroidales bacterium]MCF8350619.1 hypothetical protein [Bacteroidales bacterium]MCF8375779.1 hypothetical protein [Bacteroidales bacterium]MCF8401539.1 hypothetical protein [Bacteroidales bacterium]